MRGYIRAAIQQPQNGAAAAFEGQALQVIRLISLFCAHDDDRRQRLTQP